MLSKRALALKPSPTLALAAKAKELQTQGRDIISLSVGEPDWPTYETAVSEGISAIQRGLTKYGPSNGIPELRDAVAKMTSNELSTHYTPNEVTVSAGGKMVVFSAIQSICDHEDEVLIPAPYWVSYPTMVELADAKPVIVSTKEQNKFKMSADELSSKITNRTKMLILNSPSNPTGEVYSEQELISIADVLRKHPRVVILSDDIYNKLTFSYTLAPHILHVAPDLKDRTIIINGASKSYSMTGWRVGWALGPRPVIQAMTDYQSQSVSCTPTFCQLAALKAIQNCEIDLKNSLNMLIKRRDLGLAELSAINGIKCSVPDGAFYFFPNIQKFIGMKFKDVKITNSADFCRLLLENYGVVVVPGNEFGAEGFLRMSYVLNEAKMVSAFKRLKSFVEELKS